ncbi:NUDIX hydrolase [Nodosilinea sp. LEGE 07088]|uniref:NUDIX domain-containing protein n=1 Tax=Nodosilinea sp. LEGE 07088 TaxID=2777968 RepID=UPI0018824AE0|nr:NUDIX domain-containing protein [Nodosilinea sp. LEGE 07088]MBE9136421.1 NUDIX hydrolase [Nodosilinea sp. LEGE 07088]
MPPDAQPPWRVQDRFLELHTRWMTLIGEHWLDAQGQQLEYWRIEKADSVIVLPIQRDPLGQSHILLPPASFRPGVGQVTLDFPGGRCLAGQTPEEAAIAILHRELGLEATAIAQLTLLNPDGWAVNSSFSNQKLYGFIAYLEEGISKSPELMAINYPATVTGVCQLLDELTCLQCRAVLLEWRACLENGLQL